MSHQLYRHFAADGTLLYVGISLSAVMRLSQHRKSGWFDRVASVTITHFESEELARAAESVAIRTERPQFNKQGVVVQPNAITFVKRDDWPDDALPITPQTILAHFGSEAEIAAALGRTRQAVNLWKQADFVPRGIAYELQVLTGGKLRVDPAAYQPQKQAAA